MLVAVAVSVAVGKVVGGSDGREKIVYSGVKTLIHLVFVNFRFLFSSSFFFSLFFSFLNPKQQLSSPFWIKLDTPVALLVGKIKDLQEVASWQRLWCSIPSRASAITSVL